MGLIRLLGRGIAGTAKVTGKAVATVAVAGYNKINEDEIERKREKEYQWKLKEMLLKENVYINESNNRTQVILLQIKLEMQKNQNLTDLEAAMIVANNNKITLEQLMKELNQG